MKQPLSSGGLRCDRRTAGRLHPARGVGCHLHPAVCVDGLEGAVVVGHSRQLLDSIAEKVLLDYPQERGFSIEFEAYLPNIAYRMEPDIWIHQDGEVICVVEIGYTRPEKLSRYKELGIPDVRWYAKDGELHVRHCINDAQPIPDYEPQAGALSAGAIVTANDLRSMLLATIHGVMTGKVNVARATAVASLSGELHKSIEQEWNMRVYAAENLQLANHHVVKLLAN
jgi:hypothetical protein